MLPYFILSYLIWSDRICLSIYLSINQPTNQSIYMCMPKFPRKRRRPDQTGSHSMCEARTHHEAGPESLSRPQDVATNRHPQSTRMYQQDITHTHIHIHIYIYGPIWVYIHICIHTCARTFCTKQRMGQIHVYKVHVWVYIIPSV